MSDNHIVESGSVQSPVATVERTCGEPRQGDAQAQATDNAKVEAGRSKVRLRASMERSEAYKRLPSGAWRVIAALWELADAPRGSEPFVHGRCRVSTIADRTGLSRSQVQRWLRRLRVVPDGQPVPTGWLGGWVDSSVRAGRYLAWTVYATPSEVIEATGKGPSPEAEATDKGRNDATPDDARMRHEVAHPCVTDIPLRDTTSNNHHQHARARNDEPNAGAGAGGDEDAIRSELRAVGVWTGKIEPLAQRVEATPNGLARLRATIARGRTVANNLAAFVTKAIERDAMDEASEPRTRVRSSSHRPGMTPDEFKAWAKSWAALFRSMTDDLRSNGKTPSATVNGAKGAKYAEDPKAWAELWARPEVHRRAEVTEVFNELNRQLVSAGLDAFAPPMRSAGAAGGTVGESAEAFA